MELCIRILGYMTWQYLTVGSRLPRVYQPIPWTFGLVLCCVLTSGMLVIIIWTRVIMLGCLDLCHHHEKGTPNKLVVPKWEKQGSPEPNLQRGTKSSQTTSHPNSWKRKIKVSRSKLLKFLWLILCSKSQIIYILADKVVTKRQGLQVEENNIIKVQNPPKDWTDKYWMQYKMTEMKFSCGKCNSW